MDKLKEMKNRQKGLNREMGRSAEAGVEGEKNARLLRSRRNFVAIWKNCETNGIKKSGKLGDVASLDQAGGEMKGAAGDLRRDEPL